MGKYWKYYRKNKTVWGKGGRYRNILDYKVVGASVDGI